MTEIKKSKNTQKCSFASDGKHCNAWAMKTSSFCFSHNPETVVAKREAVIRGGKSPKKNYRPLLGLKISSTSDVVKLLDATINEVRKGEIDLRVANCIGYLSGHLIKALEISDLEKRLEDIEKYIEERNQK